MTYLIGLSGPPRSGKDSIGNTLAAIIEDRHGVQPQVMALSTPMRMVVYCLLGIEYSVAHYERHKDDPQEALGGKTIRQAMIALSEQHVKPLYGHGFWGASLLRQRWEPLPSVVIVTDMGFEAEVGVFEAEYGLGNVAWPQIVRPGTDFSNDSRSYVGSPDRRTTIINDSDVPTAAQRLYGRLVNQLRMDFG